MTAKTPNITFGNQTAINGEKSDCAAMVPKTLSKNTNIIAIVMPKARFTPIPPLLLIEDTATAIIVKMNTETGKLHFLYNSSLYLPMLEEPRFSSRVIKRFKSK